MSKKTIKQRIAVVAVSTLTAGFLSFTSAPVANAAAVAAGQFVMSATASSTNYGVVSVSASTTAEVLLNSQVEILDNADIDAGDDTDVLKLAITQGSGAFTFAQFTTAATAQAAATAANGQSVTFTASDDTNGTGGYAATYFRPSALGKVVIQYQNIDTSAGTTTVVDTLTIHVVASAAASVSGVVSVADSYFYRSATCVTGAATNIDADTSNEANGGVAYLSFLLNDAYGVANATAGALSVTSSSTDAVVAIDGAPTSTSTSTAVGAELADGTSGDGACVGIAQATANKPVTTTVTVSFNGVVIGSRTITITGQLASLKLSSTVAEGLAVAPRGSTSGTHFYVLAYDSAGKRVATSATPTVDSAGLNTVVTNVTVSGTVSSSSTSAPLGTSGYLTCSSTTSGSANVRVKHVDSVGTTIYSNTVTVRCGGETPYKVTAALDKAVYVPGDVATLTLTATDSGGLMVADTTTTGTGYAVAGSNMTAVTAPSTADTFTQGVKTYKFIVGATEGSYAMSVSFPAYVPYGVADQAVPYSIKASTATVTNADVLKSIVSLIASINKQIQALQKLILARR